MSEPIQLIVFGAAGRMGQSVLRAAAGSTDLDISAAMVRAIPKQDSGSHPVNYATRMDSGRRADVVVDFSGAGGFDSALALATQRGIPLVSGSTGLSDAQHAAMREAARSIPLLWASNFSLGVAVLTHLAGLAARLLPDWDCEIIEAHHRNKLDAPSGTALALGQHICSSRNLQETPALIDRVGKRDPEAIGYSVSRAGDIIGEHEVRLAGPGERIELIHRAGDRDLFARGALASVRWIAGRPPGMHGIGDVLGLTSDR